ncbi:MAG: TldD/PmbA family protein [Ignavibacteria bacterium]|nr:TldD/PmbA family protein [Ignavibacteria bacterium]
MTNENLNLVEWALDYAKNEGAKEVAVNFSHDRSVEIEFRDKNIETLKESTQNSLSLQIYIDNKYSSHSTNDLRKDELKKFISEAVASTKYLTKDKYRMLPDPKYYSNASPADLKIFDRGYEKIEPEIRLKLVSEVENAAKSLPGEIITAYSSYGDEFYENIKLHSNGFKGTSSGTYFSLGGGVTVKDKNDGRPEDAYYATSRFFNELPSPELIGKEAARRALRKIGQSKIESGKYSMLVENQACGRLLGLFSGAISARAIQQKASYLDGLLNKKIASERLTIIDNPFLEKGLASRTFDGEGLAVKKRFIIEKGVLNTYLIDNYYGKKLGWEPNSGSLTNIIVEPGEKSQEELMKDIKKGILITGFIGGNSNSTTGDFSFGIVGQLVENGQIVKPINEMNISGNAKEIWNQLEAIGNNPNVYSSLRCPSLLFNDIQFSGI